MIVRAYTRHLDETAHKPTVCSSHDPSSVLPYQWLPTSISLGEAIPRRRKDDSRVGLASRGTVQLWCRCSSRAHPLGCPSTLGGCLMEEPLWDQPWTPAAGPPLVAHCPTN